MKMLFRLSGLVAVAAASMSAQQALAASVYLEPATTVVAANFTGVVDLHLWMDFADNELTLGGGVDLDVTGAPATLSFTPSAWWLSELDPAFSGHGTEHADNDYEIHFGSFAGVSGLHDLGTVAVSYSGFPAGQTTSIALSINSYFGDFYSAISPYGVQTVTLSGAVVAVPEPQAFALMLLGLGVLAIPAVRRKRAPELTQTQA